MKLYSKLLPLFLGSILITSCGGGDTSHEATPPPGSSAKEAPVLIEENTSIEPLEVSLDGNDQMQFSLKTIEAVSGQKVILTFNNVGKIPVEAMGHNWTLLAQGVSPLDYANSCVNYKDNGFQNPDRINEVLASTKILGPGESETIIFIAQGEGEYPYVCTFPGHGAVMKGLLKVKAAM